MDLNFIFMKTNILFIATIVSILFLACNSQQNSTPQKAENQIGIIKGNDFRSSAMITFMDAYVNNNLSSVADLFAPDAKIMINDADLTFSQMAEGFSAGHQYFENIRHENRDAFTMHYEDGKPAGNIFTHCWYTWKATSKKTGEELSIRGYAWMKWKDDKVETVYNAFDPTTYNASMN